MKGLQLKPKSRCRNSNGLFRKCLPKSKSRINHFRGAAIQPQLKVGPTDDPLEKEADEAADAVLTKLKNGASQSIQRKCAEGNAEETLQRMTDNKEDEGSIQRLNEDEEESPVQTKSNCIKGGSPAPKRLKQQLTSSKGGGKSLSSGVLAQMNQGFGTDFSNVRVHTGSKAAQMNESIQARAFTHGSDIYFNKGQYQPGSESGKKLLAHELAHVVQQHRATSTFGKNVHLKGEIPSTGKKQEKGITKVFVIDPDNKKDKKFTNSLFEYFKSTLQVAVAKVKSIDGMMKQLLMSSPKNSVSRLIIVAHGDSFGKVLIGNKFVAPDISMVNSKLAKQFRQQVMTRKGHVEFWGCNPGTTLKPESEKRAKIWSQIYGKDYGFAKGFFAVRESKYLRESMTAKEKAANAQNKGKKVLVKKCKDIFQLLKPTDPLIGNWKKSGFKKGKEWHIKHYKKWLLKRYEHLTSTKELIPPKAKMNRQEIITSMCKLLDRSPDGVIRYIKIKSEGQDYFPERVKSSGRLNVHWKKRWIWSNP